MGNEGAELDRQQLNNEFSDHVDVQTSPVIQIMLKSKLAL